MSGFGRQQPRSGTTSRKESWPSAQAAPAASFLALATVFVDRADHVEGRLRKIVVLPATSEDLGDMERLRQERAGLRARATDQLVLLESSSMPRMAMMSCSDL